MTAYDTYPAIDSEHNFPPEVRQAVADSQENRDRIQAEIAPYYMRRWKPASFFAKDEQAVLPDNRVGSAKADFTTGATYDSSKWNLVTAIDMVTAATPSSEIVLRENLATAPNGNIGWATTAGYNSVYDPTYIRPDGKYGARKWSKSAIDTGKYFPYGRGVGQATTTSSVGPAVINGLARVVPGTSYGVGLWAVSTIDSPIGSVTFRWYDINGNNITPSSTSTGSVGGVAGVPKWYAGVATAPTGASYLSVEFYLAQLVDGLSVVLNAMTWSWNVLIEKRTTAPVAADYFDGTTLQNGSVTYRWTGTAEQSSSYQMQNDTLVRRDPSGGIAVTGLLANTVSATSSSTNTSSVSQAPTAPEHVTRKDYVDMLNSKGYKAYNQADPITSYPIGITQFLGDAGGTGLWLPWGSTAGQGFASVVTVRDKTYAGASLQIASPYNDDTLPPAFRIWKTGASAWGPWQLMASQAYVAQQIGLVKTIPAGTTTIASLAPGLWYAATTDTDAFTDHPLPGGYGWFIDKKPLNAAGSGITTIWRNTGTASAFRSFQKVAAGPWIPIAFGSQDWATITLDPAAAVGYAAPRVSITDSGTHLELDGSFTITTYTQGMTIGTLPTGYRPTASRRMGVIIDDNLGGTTMMLAGADGTIKVYAPITAAKKVILDGIRFLI
jgi:hypothetical protein